MGNYHYHKSSDLSAQEICKEGMHLLFRDIDYEYVSISQEDRPAEKV
jgi:hypothetical protein